MPNLKNFQFGLIVPATCVLLLLHFGQDFLKPIVIAGVLSLVLAAACVAWISAVLAIQLVAVAGDLPQYTAAISGKVDAIREFTVRPFERIESELKGMLQQNAPPDATAPRRQGSRATVVVPPPAPTVQALSAAAQGVSRFFLSQSIVNAIFGTVVGVGL